MQNQYDGILQFKGKWRVYQERVLTNAETYLSDHKVHIVAAPGSGKTTLGIELIRRLGAPCLILSPASPSASNGWNALPTAFCFREMIRPPCFPTT